MAFTPAQIRKIQVVRRRVPGLRDDDTWRFVLRQTGCHRTDGVPSISHPLNGNDAYETIMHRLAGYPESELDEDEWATKATTAGRRMLHALREFNTRCVAAGLVYQDGLAGFCERMTSRRSEYSDESPTRNVGDLDFSELLHVVEGFKAWMRREAKAKGVPCPDFGGKRGAG